MNEFRAQFKPVISEVKFAREWLEKSLKEISTDDCCVFINRDFIDKVRLCFSEMLANTIEYSIPPASEIKARLIYRDERVFLEIEDDGSPFDGFEHVREEAKNAHDVPNLDEGGRGLYLVDSMCSKFEYFPKDGLENKLNRTVLRYDIAR